jgi:threonine dehydratase
LPDSDDGRAASPVTLADLRHACDRITPYIRRTPLTYSYLLSRQAGCDIWLKQENRQHTGSFKPRGALNKIMSLSADERSRGVVAASAGNHALGVAYACRALGIDRADVFVQETAAPAKLAKLLEYPVNLRLAGTTYEAAQQAALAHAAASGAVFVSAYDDPAIIAGQGTCGLEIAEDLPDLEAVIVPVGGGALSAGIAVAIKATRPGARLIGVNAAASPSALLSFQRGHAIDPYDHEPTLAHGLAGGYGKAPFDVARNLIDEIVLVTEDEIRQAIIALIDSDQILAEASGVVGVAAVLFGKTRLEGKIAVVISGGNIDSGTLRSILKEGVR